MRLDDLTGKRFGRLTVIKRAKNIVYTNGRNRVAWECLCDCGSVCIGTASVLKIGDKKSCGCYRSETTKRRSTKHGKRYERLYKVWLDMKKRCTNPNYKQYKDYGGRGIKVCEAWMEDFESFYDFAMSHGYDPTAKHGECTIDRIDVDGDYCPENCRFVDMKTQNNNKRWNKHE